MKKFLIFLLPLVLAFVACDNVDEPDNVSAEFIEGLNNSCVHYVYETQMVYTRALSENANWQLDTTYCNLLGAKCAPIIANEIIIDCGKAWLYNAVDFQSMNRFWDKYCSATGDKHTIYIATPFSYNQQDGLVKFGNYEGLALSFNSKIFKIAYEWVETDMSTMISQERRFVHIYRAIETTGILNPNIMTFDSSKDGALYIIEKLRGIFGDRIYSEGHPNIDRIDNVECTHYTDLNQLQEYWQNL